MPRQSEITSAAVPEPRLPPEAAAAIVRAFWKADADRVVQERIAFAHLTQDAVAAHCWQSLRPFL
ncbi:hypothetical protein [Sphingomonas pituitosa]|uniref:hypothetical protein n=1 Tax=Sphingomonas pituitosa TaxID=99597 RepID=UPI000833F24B|nr:hypothetical protein [Sphingomonas pituitosa]